MVDEKFNFVDAEIVQHTYNNNDNYRIEDGDPTSRYACIYCSSHGIYFPNTEAEFKKRIVAQDRYDWLKNRLRNVKKHIFIRDVQKQWYLNGINGTLDTMEKVARFLAGETSNLKVIILGSSAGGYAAVLLGSLLKSDRVLTFNGQFDLEYILLDEELLRSNHIVRRCKDVESIRKYYNLQSVAEGNGNRIHYFTSAGCSRDIRQEAVAKEIERIKIFKINTDVHGIPFFLFNLRAVLDLSERELEHLHSLKTYSKIEFSLRVDGFRRTLFFLSRRMAGTVAGKFKVLKPLVKMWRTRFGNVIER